MPELLLEIGCEEIPAEDLFVLQDEIQEEKAEAAFNSKLDSIYRMRNHR